MPYRDDEILDVMQEDIGRRGEWAERRVQHLGEDPWDGANHKATRVSRRQALSHLLLLPPVVLKILRPREKDVFEQIQREGDGGTSGQLGAALGLNPSTVRVETKTGLKSLTAAFGTLEEGGYEEAYEIARTFFHHRAEAYSDLSRGNGFGRKAVRHCIDLSSNDSAMIHVCTWPSVKGGLVTRASFIPHQQMRHLWEDTNFPQYRYINRGFVHHDVGVIARWPVIGPTEHVVAQCMTCIGGVRDSATFAMLHHDRRRRRTSIERLWQVECRAGGYAAQMAFSQRALADGDLPNVGPAGGGHAEVRMINQVRSYLLLQGFSYGTPTGAATESAFIKRARRLIVEGVDGRRITAGEFVEAVDGILLGPEPVQGLRLR